jgi:hypothetical protein
MVTPQQYRGSQKRNESGRVSANRNFSAHLSDNRQEGKRNHEKGTPSKGQLEGSALEQDRAASTPDATAGAERGDRRRVKRN